MIGTLALPPPVHMSYREDLNHTHYGGSTSPHSWSVDLSLALRNAKLIDREHKRWAGQGGMREEG